MQKQYYFLNRSPKEPYSQPESGKHADIETKQEPEQSKKVKHNDHHFIEAITVQKNNKDIESLLKNNFEAYKAHYNENGAEWREHTIELCLSHHKKDPEREIMDKLWFALKWCEKNIRQSEMGATSKNKRFMDFSLRIHQIRKSIESYHIKTVGNHNEYFEGLKFTILSNLSVMSESEKKDYWVEIYKAMKIDFALEQLSEIESTYTLINPDQSYNFQVGDPEGILKLRDDLRLFQNWLSNTFKTTETISGQLLNVAKGISADEFSNQARAYIIHFMVDQGLILSHGQRENGFKKIVKAKYLTEETNYFKFEKGMGDSYQEYRKIIKNNVQPVVFNRCMNEIISYTSLPSSVINQAKSLRTKENL